MSKLIELGQDFVVLRILVCLNFTVDGNINRRTSFSDSLELIRDLKNDRMTLLLLHSSNKG